MPKLVGDKRRFKQILLNLVKNALKFTREGEITVTMNYEQNMSLQMMVSDTGMGFKPEDLSILFTRFGKLSRTAEQNSEGIGLGLTIVKDIVEKADGTVHAFSQGVDQGSTFTVVIPMQVSQENKSSGSISESDSENAPQEPDLIVFDEHPSFIEEATKR